MSAHGAIAGRLADRGAAKESPEPLSGRGANERELGGTDEMTRQVPSPATSDARIGRITPVIVVLAAVVPFYPALDGQFVHWDDYENIVHNPEYRGLGWGQLSWMFTTFHMGHYQPLSWVTLGLDYLLWGTRPFGYHLTNIILHAANALLFYLVCTFLLADARVRTPEPANPRGFGLGAGLAALIFAVHPLRVESVAWVTERRDVLSALFFLVSIYGYLRSQHTEPDGSRWRWLSFSLVACGCSLLAKATAMALPLVLLLLDVHPLRRLPGNLREWLKPAHRGILLEKVPFLVLAVAFAGTALAAQQHAGALRLVPKYYSSLRATQASYGVFFYLWKSVWPSGLSPLYELPFDFDAWLSVFVASTIGVLGITAVLYRFRRRWPALLACWLYYLIMLAPVSGVAQSGPQLAADRYTYFSCLSWALLLGGVFERFWNATSERVGCGPASRVPCIPIAAALLIFASLTWRQTQVWQDTKSLWRHAVAVGPPSSMAHSNLAKALADEGDVRQALALYRQAVAINPAYADAHYDLARLLSLNGEPAEAIEHYRRALAIRPDDPDSRYNFGLLLASQGQEEAALGEFHRVAALAPGYTGAFFNLGRIYGEMGELEKSVENYQRALASAPYVRDIHRSLANAHLALAQRLAGQGRERDAENHRRHARGLLNQPADGEAPAGWGGF